MGKVVGQFEVSQAACSAGCLQLDRFLSLGWGLLEKVDFELALVFGLFFAALLFGVFILCFPLFLLDFFEFDSFLNDLVSVVDFHFLVDSFGLL